MIIDPKMLELLQKQVLDAMPAAAAAVPATPPAPAPDTPLPTPPMPPASPPPVPEPDTAVPNAPQADAFGNSVKPPAAFNLAALLRGLAEIVPRPPAPTRSTPNAAPAPPGHRPQGGALPMRQAIPGNPYLRIAAPGAPAIRPARRGLLDG